MSEPSHIPEPSLILKAAEGMDWQQVVLNGGPPCFHLDDDGTFCGRALRWHSDDTHPFIALHSLLLAGRMELNRRIADLEVETTRANELQEKLDTVTLGQVANLKAELKETNEALTNAFASMDKLRPEIDNLRGQLEIDGDVIKTLGEEISKKTHLLEWGWTIIANKSGGDWTKESADWQEAAAKWRDEYHATR